MTRGHEARDVQSQGLGRAANNLRIPAALTGQSRAIRELRAAVAQAAPAGDPVLVRGETGTGREEAARHLHAQSGRPGAFVNLGCATLPQGLVETELFGHERGSFAGAVQHKPGRIELAAGGTLYLDEVEKLAPSMQWTLLYVIENGEFTRVGGSRPLPVMARIVAGTSLPIDAHVAAGLFNRNLFARLARHVITVPALRERREDIPALFQHYLSGNGRASGLKPADLPEDIAGQLEAHDWPENVSELKRVAERLADCGTPEEMPETLTQAMREEARRGAAGEADRAELETLLGALATARWNKRQAADLLGISYSSLRRRIARHGLTKE